MHSGHVVFISSVFTSKRTSSVQSNVVCVSFREFAFSLYKLTSPALPKSWFVLFYFSPSLFPCPFLTAYPTAKLESNCNVHILVSRPFRLENVLGKCLCIRNTYCTIHFIQINYSNFPLN
jgi:hypothetical protein